MQAERDHQAACEDAARLAEVNATANAAALALAAAAGNADDDHDSDDGPALAYAPCMQHLIVTVDPRLEETSSVCKTAFLEMWADAERACEPSVVARYARSSLSCSVHHLIL